MNQYNASRLSGVKRFNPKSLSEQVIEREK